jgi:hypothetical protein
MRIEGASQLVEPRSPPARRAGRVLRGLALVLLAASCGGPASPTGLTPGGPWSEALAPVFDDTVDFVTPLRTILGTEWFDEYGAQLERRLAAADVVAVVRVTSIVPGATEQAPGSIEATVEESLSGGATVGSVLRLDLDPGAGARVRDDRARIEELGRFVAFVRLYADTTGDVRNHWHLSPRDDDLLSVIRRVLQPPPEP